MSELEKEKENLQRLFKITTRGVITRIAFTFILAVIGALMKWWIIYFLEFALIYIQLQAIKQLQPLINDYHFTFTYQMRTTEQHLQEAR